MKVRAVLENKNNFLSKMESWKAKGTFHDIHVLQVSKFL